MKLTEWDKCVLYLIERGGEVRVCEIAGKVVEGQFIGSQADRRMLDIMEDVEKNGYWELRGMRYFIEKGKSGKYVTYKVTGAEHKPRHMFEPLIINGIVMRREILI